MSSRAPAARPSRAAGPFGADAGWLAGVAAATLLAALLRVVALRQVPLDPFYDAAVRSMGLSWHNFFFGAFDPRAIASVDKPPLDLWLQVISVKLLGFKPVALKAPTVLAATLAVPLLYDLVRRFAGRAAGLIAALALAVMPVSVLTARSDTMDSLMMALLVLAAWLVARAGDRRRTGPLILAGVALGLAFNTKLLEALVAAPALALLAWLACGWGERHARLLRIALGVVAFVVVALAWVAIVSLVPLRERPYPIGSTNGSPWNVVFVYNGTDRLLKAPRPESSGAPGATVMLAAASARRTQALALAAVAGRRVRSSASATGPLRLFVRSRLEYGSLIGVLLLAGTLFGALALVVLRPAWRLDSADGAPGVLTPGGGALVALATWLVVGYVLFSFSGRLHPRYLEAFTPAVAAAVGTGLAALGARARSPWPVIALLAGLLLTVADAAAVGGAGSIDRAGVLVAALCAALVAGAGLVALALHRHGAGGWPWWWIPGLVTAGATAAVLAFPFAHDVRLVRDHTGAQAGEADFPPRLSAALSRFLRAHQGHALYEFAAASPIVAATVLTRDVRPILPLTSYDARPLVTRQRLQQAVAHGQVRYLITRGTCPPAGGYRLVACVPAVRWAIAHARDVTWQLRTTTGSGVLFEIHAGSPR